ncbi:conserved protein of unknown function [Kyrpidia spormannii]|uniref:Calcineurin-like phosphoesterase domain-containing protein n=1 Tax=Kyrpidia spormannii TaxID=2055160 RepID=A0A6F9E2P9_9BACL|nr:conserved protein of unknown function [Kyrpidia spormannii]
MRWGVGPVDRLKLVHCADLHLDSPFVGLEGEDAALQDRLYEATFDSFSRIVDVCLQEQADALTVGGDVYDRETRSLRAQLRFRDALARLSQAGIPVFVVHGNHDPLSGWSHQLTWPEGVHVFGPKVEAVPLIRGGREVARIWGVSYGQAEVRENPAPEFAAAVADNSGEGWRIGLLHANVGGDPGHESYAPCSVEELADVGMDLWLLGHVHGARFWHHRGVHFLYPGTSQGRHRREKGPKGCYILTLGPNGVEAEFRATDSLRWEDIEISIGGITGEEELVQALDDRLEKVRKAAGRPVIVDVRFVGRGPVAGLLRRDGFLEEWLSESRTRWFGGGNDVWINRLDAVVGGERNLEKWLDEPTFVGELLRYVQERREAGQWAVEAREVLGKVMRFVHRRGEPEDWIDVEDWTDRAVERLLDELVAEGES